MGKPVFSYILLKLASRCNINCDYCYWFRDDSVYSKPKILTLDAENLFIKRLREHIENYDLKKFSVLLHGGEPLLFGKKRFFQIARRLNELSDKTECRISLSMTTNGTLIDNEWAAIFKLFNVSVTLSIDGPKEVHDKHRVDFSNNGTYDRVLHGIKILKKFGITPGVLAVADLDTAPQVMFDSLAKNLGLQHFDIMIPDFTHEDHKIKRRIDDYYIQLFDYWYKDEFHRLNIDCRIINSFLLGLLGYSTTSEGLGYGPLTTLTMLTDGTLEPLDVLRIAKDPVAKSTFNVRENKIQDAADCPHWIEAYEASINLPIVCQKCEYMNACGGGYLPHRWSISERFNNPSVYCDDLKNIYKHINEVLSKEIELNIWNDTSLNSH